ncbi:MAG: hypothetical protein JWO69_786 [Thermoleophilia bacterium]|nr:hypothetical protein [Thermoleophilia bacterium]
MTTKSTPAKKTAIKKPTAAKKPAAKKTATKKTATKATAKKAAPTVRRGTVKATTSANGAGLGVTREALLKKLVKLSSSKQDAVALDATKTLLTYVK